MVGVCLFESVAIDDAGTITYRWSELRYEQLQALRTEVMEEIHSASKSMQSYSLIQWTHGHMQNVSLPLLMPRVNDVCERCDWGTPLRLAGPFRGLTH